MKQGQETNQIWTQEAATQDMHDRGLTYSVYIYLFIFYFLKVKFKGWIRDEISCLHIHMNVCMSSSTISIMHHYYTF